MRSGSPTGRSYATETFSMGLSGIGTAVMRLTLKPPALGDVKPLGFGLCGRRVANLVPLPADCGHVATDALDREEVAEQVRSGSVVGGVRSSTKLSTIPRNESHSPLPRLPFMVGAIR